MGILAPFVLIVAATWVAGIFVPLLAGLAGAPGALVATKDGQEDRGFLLCLIGQAIVAGVYNWGLASFTHLFARAMEGPWGLFLWIVAFLGAMRPFGAMVWEAIRTSDAQGTEVNGKVNQQYRAAILTLPFAALVFIVSAFVLSAWFSLPTGAG